MTKVIIASIALASMNAFASGTAAPAAPAAPAAATAQAPTAKGAHGDMAHAKTAAKKLTAEECKMPAHKDAAECKADHKTK